VRGESLAGLGAAVAVQFFERIPNARIDFLGELDERSR